MEINVHAIIFLHDGLSGRLKYVYCVLCLLGELGMEASTLFPNSSIELVGYVHTYIGTWPGKP